MPRARLHRPFLPISPRLVPPPPGAQSDKNPISTLSSSISILSSSVSILSSSIPILSGPVVFHIDSVILWSATISIMSQGHTVHGTRTRQRLTLVHFSAQPEPFLSPNLTESAQRVPRKVLTSSQKVDQCMPFCRVIYTKPFNFGLISICAYNISIRRTRWRTRWPRHEAATPRVILPIRKNTHVFFQKLFVRTVFLGTFSSPQRLFHLPDPAHIFPPTTPTTPHRVRMPRTSFRVLNALALAASLSLASAAHPFTSRALLETTGKCTRSAQLTRQGRPRVGREVVQRSRVRKFAPAEPALSLAP